MKRKLPIRYMIPGLFMLLGALFAYFGVSKYGLWDSVKGPIAGFFPFLLGLIIVVVGFIDLVFAIKRNEEQIQWKNFLIALAVAAVIAMSYVIGLLASTFLFLFLWLWKVEKYPLRTTLTVVVIVFVMIYLLFVLWLKVPFERGILGEQIVKMLK